ncbi:Protochlorophyllide-dependent translocon component 52 [Ranunculus cassubicifolius]
MEAIKASSFSSSNPSTIPTIKHQKFPISSNTLNFPKQNNPKSLLSSKFRLNSSTISTPSISENLENDQEETTEKFDWYSHWYPIMPLCDLDKRVPHAKRVLGIDIVVWWDRNEESWQVFDDSCPHRLAPLSEGRIDQWGRLQCVYHGWCFNGSGDCKLIPQAPDDGPPVNTFKKACATVYPSIVQNQIIWFWPSSDPQFKDIAVKQKPPYIAGLDDPSFTPSMGNRDIPYGYEVLTENLMDPSHVPYAHYGIMKVPADKTRPKADREGGKPMEVNSIQTSDINGYFAKQERGFSKFIAPCVFYFMPKFGNPSESASPDSVKEESSKSAKERRLLLIFICIPVSPGKSRLIWAFPRNFGVWVDRIVPRWMFHIGQNLILDSDLYLLHLEEHKIVEAGPMNWQKACFVPTKADALVVAFRKWLRKYSDGQVNWGTKFNGTLPPTTPKEQLMDRYRSHVLNCSSCRVAVKGLKALEVALQVISIASIAIVAAIKQGVMSVAAKYAVVTMAVLGFTASKWLSHFIYKNFYFHDYNHGLV